MLATRRPLLALACPLLLSGCQYSYTFAVSGVVKSAATGKALAGVKVFSTRQDLAEFNPDATQPDAVTGKDGAFAFTVRVPDIHFMAGSDRRWHLLFNGQGLKEAVDLHGAQAPESAKTIVPVFVVVYMNGEKSKH
jgi:hypothetical protein